jgi:hypothetical protein
VFYILPLTSTSTTKLDLTGKAVATKVKTPVLYPNGNRSRKGRTARVVLTKITTTTTAASVVTSSTYAITTPNLVAITFILLGHLTRIIPGTIIAGNFGLRYDNNLLKVAIVYVYGGTVTTVLIPKARE